MYSTVIIQEANGDQIFAISVYRDVDGTIAACVVDDEAPFACFGHATTAEAFAAVVTKIVAEYPPATRQEIEGK
jgi:hypothetical protein